MLGQTLLNLEGKDFSKMFELKCIKLDEQKEQC